MTKIVWLVMSSMFSLFSLQVLEVTEPDVLDFRLFSEFAILGWF